MTPETSSFHVALLRGINVGGKNIIRMEHLRRAFEEEGFEAVSTYIQSGNVLFRAPARRGSGRAKLVRRIEALLSDRFDYDASVVVRARAELSRVVEDAPEGFGRRPKEYRYDVAFLKETLEAEAALAAVPLREGVDRAWAGEGALYLQRLTRRATQSRINRITSLPIYRDMTIRNWNTTTTLLGRMEG